MYNKRNKFIYLFIYSLQSDGRQEGHPACKKQGFVIFYVLHVCILFFISFM